MNSWRAIKCKCGILRESIHKKQLIFELSSLAQASKQRFDTSTFNRFGFALVQAIQVGIKRLPFSTSTIVVAFFLYWPIQLVPSWDCHELRIQILTIPLDGKTKAHTKSKRNHKCSRASDFWNSIHSFMDYINGMKIRIVSADDDRLRYTHTRQKRTSIQLFCVSFLSLQHLCMYQLTSSATWRTSTHKSKHTAFVMNYDWKFVRVLLCQTMTIVQMAIRVNGVKWIRFQQK